MFSAEYLNRAADEAKEKMNEVLRIVDYWNKKGIKIEFSVVTNVGNVIEFIVPVSSNDVNVTSTYTIEGKA